MSETDQLGEVNNQLVAEGQSFPEATLKNGSKIRTGTLGALLNNIRRYNAGEKGLEGHMRLAIPTVFKAGLFDLFPPDQWKSESNAGRTLVGQMGADYLEQQGLKFEQGQHARA
ncbi:hypothetical protein MMC29_001308 [Sticta canariensis]|nr:hypothetical protein [Sticta canariensis]